MVENESGIGFRTGKKDQEMMRKPDVSIIIPVYNRAERIRMTLDSVLAQTCADWECIVVDDGSTDSTEEVVMEYVRKDERFRFTMRPENRPKGPSAARNHGLSLARGRYVHFFDSDDFMSPDFISKAVSRFETNPACELLLVGFREIILRGGKSVAEREVLPGFTLDEAFLELITKKQVVQTACGVWSKEAMERLGLSFDESLFKPEDFELYARAFAGGIHFEQLATPCYELRQTEDGIMSEFNKGNPRMLVDHIRARRLALRAGRCHRKAGSEVRNHLRGFAIHYAKRSVRQANVRAFFHCWLLYLETLTF